MEHLTLEHNVGLEVPLKASFLHFETGQAHSIVEGPGILSEQSTLCSVVLPQSMNLFGWRREPWQDKLTNATA